MADELRVALNEATLNSTVIDQVAAKLRALQAAGNLNALVTIRVETTGVEQAIANIGRVSKAAITAEEVAARRAQLYGGTRGGSALPPGAPIAQYVGGEDAEEAEVALQRAVKERFLVAQSQIRDANEAAKLVGYRARLSNIDKFQAGSLSGPETILALQQFEQETAARESLHKFDKATPAYIEQSEREAAYSSALKRKGDIFAGAPPQYPGGGGGGGDDEGGGLFGRFGKRLQGLAFYLGAAAVLYPISSALFQAAENATKLETSLIHIQGILGSQSLSDRVAIRKEIVDTADRFSLDINQVAEAAERFAQQGESIGKIGSDLQNAAIGAQALGISIDRAEELILSVKNITGSDEQSGSIFDKIFAVRRGSPVTPETLIQGVEQLLPLVSQLHGAYSGLVSDVDVVLGAISTVSKETNAASSTSLRFVLGRLGNEQTVRKVEALSGVGFGTTESNGTQLRPLVNILSDLAAAYQRLEAAHSPKALELLQELAGSRQTRDVAVLLKNWGDAMQTTERAAYSMGEAVGQAGRQLDSVQNKIQQTKNNLTAFAESMLESAVVGGALKGALFLVNTGIEGLNGGIGSTILTVVILTGVITGLTFALRALRTTALTGSIAELLGLSATGAGATVIAFGEIAAAIAVIGLTIAGAVAAVHSLSSSATDTSALAIDFVGRNGIQGQGQAHLTEFNELASTIGVSRDNLYTNLASAAEVSAAKFRDATGAINTTRKAFVDDFLNEVIKRTPEFGKYLANITEGLSPSDAALARLNTAQNVIGQIAYLSNAIGNAHINQLTAAGESLLTNINGEVGGLRPITGARGAVSGDIRGLPPEAVAILAGQNLFQQSEQALGKLSPTVAAASSLVLETANGMGVLDNALKVLSSDAGKGKDVWEEYANALNDIVKNPITGPQFVGTLAANLQKAFIADPKKFGENLLGTGGEGVNKGAADFAEALHNAIKLAMEKIAQNNPGDTFAPLLKDLDIFLRKDKGTLAQFDSLNTALTRANNPLSKFLENMYLTLQAVNANADAAKRLGLAYNEPLERLNAIQNVGKQFYQLPLTSLRGYLDQLQNVNELSLQAREAQAHTQNLGKALGGQAANTPELGAAAQAAGDISATANKRLQEAITRLDVYNDAINQLKGASVVGIRNNALALFASRGAGQENPEYQKFVEFVNQFATDQSILKGLAEGTEQYREASAKLVVDAKRIGDFIDDFNRKALADYTREAISRQGPITQEAIRKNDISSLATIQRSFIANALAVSGRAKPEISDKIGAIRAQETVDLITAQQEHESALLAIDQQRGILSGKEIADRTIAADAALQEATAKAHTLSTEQQILAIDKEITQNQADYNNQINANATARLSGLKEVLGDVTKLTKGKELQIILGGAGKQFYERGVENLLSAFNPNKGFGVFQQIGTFLGSAGEPDPITQSFTTGAAIVSTAIVSSFQIGAGYINGAPAIGAPGLNNPALIPLEAQKLGITLPTSVQVPDPKNFGKLVNAPLGKDLADLISQQDKQKALLGLGSTVGIDIGELLGAKSQPGSNVRTPGPNAQAGSQFLSAVGSGVGLKLIGGVLGGPIGALAGGVLGGLLGGLFDHPKPNPIQAHLERIEGNTKDQVTLLQNTNRLLEASGLNFNVSSSFKLPRYGVDTFIGGGAGSRGGGAVVSAGTASVANTISVAVNIGNTSATAADIGKMVAQAVSDRLESEYSTGGRYVSTRTHY